MVLKKFFNQEKGIALLIVSVVTVILFLSVGALFIYIQSEGNRSMADRAKEVSMLVGNSGAERVIWYIQHKLDSNPNWIPQDGKNLFIEEKCTVSYDNLYEEREPEIYKNYGICLNSADEGYSYLYASKMIHENDPTTPEEEWAIYTIGVMRSPLLWGKKTSIKKISRIRVLIRIGTGNVQFPLNTIHCGAMTKPNNQILLPYSDNDGNSNIYVRDGVEETIGHILHECFRPNNPHPDGYDGEFNYITTANHVPSELDTARDANSKITITTGAPEQQTPSFNLDYFKNIADYIGKDGVIKDCYGRTVPTPRIKFISGPDDRKVYKISTYIVLKKSQTQQPNYPSSYELLELFDKNNDDTTILYLEDGAFRMDTNEQIIITPDTEGVIATRGRWINTTRYDDNLGNPKYGYHDMNNKMNDNIGIDFRGQIKETDRDGKMLRTICAGTAISALTEERVSWSQVESYIGFDRTDLGKLDFFSEYDILFAPPDMVMQGTEAAADQKTIWRGFIYSNGTIHNYLDLLLKGAIMSRNEFQIGDQGKLGKTVMDNYRAAERILGKRNYYTYTDNGADIIIGYENIQENRSYIEKYGKDILPQQGGGHAGRITILSWEQSL